ncbi:MAG: flagellar transcriptional regulator FlhD [Pseudomonadota bacterium]
MEPDFMLPSAIEARIRKFNAEYLSFAQELARTSPAAAPLLGVTQEVVDILEAAPLSKFQALVCTNMLISQLRIVDPGLWRKLAEGKVDRNQLLHAFVKTVPAEFVP